MYDMDQLLTMLTIEKARELRFRGGRPPVIVSEDEEHSLQGPPNTGGGRGAAPPKHGQLKEMRDLRACGAVQFIYLHEAGHPFWFGPGWRTRM